MFQSIFLNLVLNYLAHAITTAEGQIKWDAIQASLDSKLKALLPGWIEPEIQLILDNSIALVKGVAGAPDVASHLLKLIVAKDFSGIASYLKQLVLSQLQPSALMAEVSDEKFVELVQCYKAA